VFAVERHLFLVLRWVPQPQRLARDAIIGGSQRFLRGGSKEGAAIAGMPEMEANCAIPRYLGLPPLQCQVPFDAGISRIDSLLCTTYVAMIQEEVKGASNPWPDLPRP
jgi:hypothetical protein